MIISELNKKIADKELRQLSVSMFINSNDKPKMRELLESFIEKPEEKKERKKKEKVEVDE